MRGATSIILLAMGLAGCFVDLAGPEEPVGGLEWLTFEAVVNHDAPDAGGGCQYVFPRVVGGPGSVVTALGTEVIRVGSEVLSIATLYHPGGGHPTRLCGEETVVEVEYPQVPRFSFPDRVFRIPVVVRDPPGRITRDTDGEVTLPLRFAEASEVSVPHFTAWVLEVEAMGGGVARLTFSEQVEGYAHPTTHLAPAVLAALPPDRPLRIRLSVAWWYHLHDPEARTTAYWYSSAQLTWEMDPVTPPAPPS